MSTRRASICPALLRKRGIDHCVLNAKHHEKEAEIVAQAGKFGAVTIATNMAGRGTDIMLGGNAEYMAKNDLRKAHFEDEVIQEATGFAETDDETVLAARELFRKKLEENRQVTAAEAERVRQVAGFSFSAPSAMSPGASTTSCAAAPAGRAIPGRAAFISP